MGHNARSFSAVGPRSWELCPSDIKETDVLKLGGAQEKNVVVLDILGDNLSLQLLCLVAFGKETPPEELEHLVKKAQNHCGGLPLALKTVGSRAKSDSPETLECWQKIVDDLNEPRWNEKNVGTDNGRQSPHYTLKSSVEAAPQDARTCFILIGAFLLPSLYTARLGLTMWLSAAVHDGKYQNCINSLNELEKRALISWDTDEELVMHDLFVDIATEFVDIAREEAREVPSLFFFYRESRGTKQLASPAHMFLEGPQDKPLRVPENLWSLISLDPTSTSAWEGHMSEFGSNLRAVIAKDLSAEEISVACFRKLKFLHLEGSELRALKGLEAMSVLEVLDLSFCESLTGLEGLEAMPSLQVLDLTWCRSLIGLEGLGAMSALQVLDLSWCKSLTGLERLGAISALQVLNLSCCKSLMGLEGLGAMSALQKLDLRWCESLTRLEGLGTMSALQVLNLGGCKSLTGLEGLGAMTSLVEIDMRFCHALVTLPAYPAGSRVLFPGQFMEEGGGIPTLLPAPIALLKSDLQVEQEAAVRTMRHMAGRCNDDMIAIGKDRDMLQALVQRMGTPANPSVQLAAMLAVLDPGEVSADANMIPDRESISAHLTWLLTQNPELRVAPPDMLKLSPQLEAQVVPQFLPAYVEILNSGEAYDQIRAAISLKDTARSFSSHRRAVGGHEGVLPALLKLISPGVNRVVQQIVLLAVWELQKDDAIRATVETSEFNQEYLTHLLGPGFPFSTSRAILNTEFQGVRHGTITCDGCGLFPIEGVRYISSTRDDYDLCSRCFMQAEDTDSYVALTGYFR